MGNSTSSATHSFTELCVVFPVTMTKFNIIRCEITVSKNISLLRFYFYSIINNSLVVHLEGPPRGWASPSPVVLLEELAHYGNCMLRML